MGSNPRVVDFFFFFFSSNARHVIGVRILVRSIFSPSSFFSFLAGSAILSKDVVCVVVLTSIRGIFFLACMAVNNIRAAVTQ